jgi:hypothetical protein
MAKLLLVSGFIIPAILCPVKGAEPVEESGEFQAPLPGKKIFEIRGSHNLNGAIKILSQPTDEIKVTFKKWARAATESQARRFIDLIDLKLEPLGDDREVLTVLTPSDAPWQGTNYGARLDVFIELPGKMRIEGDLRFMELGIRGPFQGVNVKSEYSPLEIEAIRGPIEVSASFASISLSEIAGSIKAETQNGSIEATDIKVPLGSAIFQSTNGSINLFNIVGPVEAYTSYSDIRAKDIDADEGSVVLRTSYSSIDVSDVKGELICETTFSEISIAGASLTHGHSKIETTYSPIKASFDRISNSQLFINNHYNNIIVSMPANTSSQIVASVDDGGKIRTSNLPLKPTFLGATRLEGVLDDGQGRIELTVSGIGEINIKGR